MNYHRVAPPAKWRLRHVRQVAWLAGLLVLWLGGTAYAVAVWWRDHPRPGVVDAIGVAVGLALLLGCAIGHRRPQRKETKRSTKK